MDWQAAELCALLTRKDVQVFQEKSPVLVPADALLSACRVTGTLASFRTTVLIS